MIPTDTAPPSKPAQGHKGYKNRRRLSRELALQGIYQWRLAGGNAQEIDLQLQQVNFYSKADGSYFSDLLQGVLEHSRDLEAQIQAYLDRQLAELSPVECSILLIGTYEMVHHPEIPCRAIINEAIELAKSYGGTDGHKYVNGVLDKLAAQLRAVELQSSPVRNKDPH
ncbi:MULTISPECIES: transcription antitermination factor NusB [Nitrosomonas]|uniref:Transcription antitermination protein NusB n=2 Tax=Nitrosomonas eutropha TaxID=916 RepID=NUSB_NITEC|nr:MULTISPECIES: transcription antitermination factor NusB [Nitrosomonas]Q0AD60.1 RecName: Full=Transcription antitermination protein NusB; AltName: Full=Antitermination factor NusB [Nitrosomonas eutropha C91]ABI60722.1 NusB antitermination factor [Nitrosomonas eutropha C91]MXS80149.1 transcription antitermination factor NusB [Nitrosomonas sp. GH22]PXV79425.1 NusB antitermination factor [Nitrosomonas eutropha]SCX27605.1 NusB antitermination factor [Nitrosomonas eutropha]SDW07965.1 NusB antite